MIICRTNKVRLWTHFHYYSIIQSLKNIMTCYSPRHLLLSHYLVRNKNHLFIVGIGPICDRELWFNFSTLSYVHFMSGYSTIRYIYDTQHLNIFYIISYFGIFSFFEHFPPYNIITIILIRLNRTAGPSRCLLFSYLQYIFCSNDQ